VIPVLNEESFDEINALLRQIGEEEKEKSESQPLIFIGSGCDAQTCFFKSQQHL